MAGLLAWAADVVGKSGHINGADDDDPNSIPLILTDEQQAYVQELNRKAASLSRAIQDLRLRLPPPDISQRLPHLHAHSLASNAALALQLNAHSATKEQVFVSLLARIFLCNFYDQLISRLIFGLFHVVIEVTAVYFLCIHFWLSISLSL